MGPWCADWELPLCERASVQRGLLSAPGARSAAVAVLRIKLHLSSKHCLFPALNILS